GESHAARRARSDSDACQGLCCSHRRGFRAPGQVGRRRAAGRPPACAPARWLICSEGGRERVKERQLDRNQRTAAIEATLEKWEEVAATGSFEDALDALEAIVTLLDEGDLTLDLSVQCLETGTRL